MDPRKILVTGGAGYIGSHVCKQLALSGFAPITVDNLVYGHEWAVKWGPLHKADILGTAGLTQILEKEKIEAVIHLAAFAYVGESVRDPIKYYHNNVEGTLSLMKACEAVGVKKIVFSSSCATYGVPLSVPITESVLQNPVSPYGKSKWMCEQILRDLCDHKNLRCVSLRYFNAAGADGDGEIGEDHDPETHLIPIAIECILQSREFQVFGGDYATPDGTCIRDYIHVTDLADAHVKALKYMDAEEGFHAFNLGTGKGHSVLEVLKTLENLSSQKIKTKIGARRPGDPPELVADGTKARRTLNWKPQHSDLPEIIETALRWHQDHLV